MLNIIWQHLLKWYSCLWQCRAEAQKVRGHFLYAVGSHIFKNVWTCKVSAQDWVISSMMGFLRAIAVRTACDKNLSLVLCSATPRLLSEPPSYLAVAVPITGAAAGWVNTANEQKQEPSHHWGLVWEWNPSSVGAASSWLILLLGTPALGEDWLLRGTHEWKRWDYNHRCQTVQKAVW